MNYIIVSFITKDKPGIVKYLSDIISEHHGNWQKSSLHQMSGFFSGVIEVAVPTEHSKNLSDNLSNLPDFKMHIEQVSNAEKSPETHLILDLTANDRPGIVQEISTVISQQGGNLIKLVSTRESAPHSGQDLFKAKITLTSHNNDIDTLVDALEHLADDLMVDISR